MNKDFAPLLNKVWDKTDRTLLVVVPGLNKIYSYQYKGVMALLEDFNLRNPQSEWTVDSVHLYRDSLSLNMLNIYGSGPYQEFLCNHYIAKVIDTDTLIKAIADSRQALERYPLEEFK